MNVLNYSRLHQSFTVNDGAVVGGRSHKQMYFASLEENAAETCGRKLLDSLCHLGSNAIALSSWEQCYSFVILEAIL